MPSDLLKQGISRRYSNRDSEQEQSRQIITYLATVTLDELYRRMVGYATKYIQHYGVRTADASTP